MRKSVGAVALGAALAAGVLLPLGSGTARAAEKTYAVVVKAMDNPFFDLVRDGCQKAAKEIDGAECLYIGPSSHTEADQLRIIDDLLSKGVDAIAISPSNAPAVANLLKRRKPGIPVITIDADVLAKDADVRTSYVGTDNYELGVALAEQLKKAKPGGGTLCLIMGGPAADNINQRAQGSRDTLSGKKGIERLNGEGGWTEIAGCPLYTNDDAALGVQMMADVLTANPDLDAFIAEGGWPQFAPQAYAQLTDQYLDRIKSGKLAMMVADTLPPQIQALKEGRSHVQVGQRPFEMGYRAMFVMNDLVGGKTVAPTVYTGLDTCTAETADTCLKK
ncbi:sugar ABC transporter substrate-binding protein [Thalassobaculum fulvum]|uniref:Sugar ABC transporter substrate-binding protein n=1 Tax=Thalassobaculum fulvum TaxID=1633335 RepID=A0A919CRY2_9PROT|nr:sugar-binding protein [Thalassobaculum fulvum]GHD60003.1 sugar ABC transporter substrate-binding protein [Thalassobaculum fulvum]